MSQHMFAKCVFVNSGGQVCRALTRASLIERVTCARLKLRRTPAAGWTGSPDRNCIYRWPMAASTGCRNEWSRLRHRSGHPRRQCPPACTSAAGESRQRPPNSVGCRRAPRRAPCRDAERRQPRRTVVGVARQPPEVDDVAAKDDHSLSIRNVVSKQEHCIEYGWERNWEGGYEII